MGEHRFIDLSKKSEKEKRQKLLWQIPLLIVLMIALVPLVSNIISGHYNPFPSSGDSSSLLNGQTPTPVPKTDITALKDYFNEALPIVEGHSSTMDTVYEAIEAIKAIYSQPQKNPPTIQALTTEGVVAFLKAKGTVDGGIHKMENALQKVESEIVDFGILSPPAEAMDYHNLITNCFLKDKVALSDWFYYYTSLRESGFVDEEALERANRHYEEARELQLQAEREREALPL